MAVLRSVTGSLSLTYARAPVPLTGGFWAELFAFSLARPPDGWPHDLVARMMPEASTARRETLVQAAVAAAGFPTPIVRAAGGPDDGLGRAFMVMDRAPGAPLLSGLSLTGALGRGPALFGEIPRLLASTMARRMRLIPSRSAASSRPPPRSCRSVRCWRYCAYARPSSADRTLRSRRSG